jgi:hypothetical protein
MFAALSMNLVGGRKEHGVVVNWVQLHNVRLHNVIVT